MTPFTHIRNLIEQHHPGDATVRDCGNGHLQIEGRLLVNYYPESRRRTAYIDATKQGRHHVTPEQALSMAFQAPPLIAGKVKRTGQTGAKKRLLRAAIPVEGKYRCMWCSGLFTPAELTVEHIIPLARGGLNNANNKGLACQPCNSNRGHDMPELKNAAADGRHGGK